MAAAAEKTARDDQSGEALAEATGLEYLKASAVSVDPRALSLLEREDCKRLRAIPLAAGSGGAVVAVSSPGEERLAAIRELTGEQTRFVLISEGTLDALLGSRMFADAPATIARAAASGSKMETAQERTPEQATEKTEVDPVAGPDATARRNLHEEDGSQEPAVEEPAATEDAAVPEDTAPPERAAEQAAPPPDAAVENIVGAVLSALKHRVGSGSEGAPVETPVKAATESAALPSSTEELLAHLDATVQSWTALRTALANIHSELEDAKRALRDTKDQLSVAHADNDQYRKRVRTLEGELAESRELVVQARTRLQEATELLEADPTQLRESADLL